MRLFRWCFSARVLRLVVRLFAGLAVILALFYCEEDLRGWRAWTNYLSHSGITPVQLDVRAYIPKPIPDDQNFAATPVVKRWFVVQTKNEPFNSDHFSKAPSSLVQPLKDVEKYQRRQPLDLQAWQDMFSETTRPVYSSTRNNETSRSSQPSQREAATAVLAFLQDDEATLQSLRTASMRSKACYPVKYNLEDPWSTLLPHASNIKELAVRVELKACAELIEGDSDKAFDDVMFTLYLADTLTNDSIVVSYLIRAVCVHAVVQPIWEGLVQERWSESQLHQMQTRLLQFHFIADLDNPLKSERAEGILTVDLTKRRGVRYLARIATTEPNIFEGPLGRVFDLAIPSGWFALEKVNYCRAFNNVFTNTFDPTAGTISPLRIASHRQELDQETGGSGRTAAGIILSHRTVVRLLLTALPNVLFRAAIAQTAANQAALACALERYRLANSDYPVSLDALVPQWISIMPHDVIDGEAYRYRRIEPNRFILYSVGWNQKDDGGKQGESLFGREGDWVWEYPRQHLTQAQ